MPCLLKFVGAQSDESKKRSSARRSRGRCSAGGHIPPPPAAVATAARVAHKNCPPWRRVGFMSLWGAVSCLGVSIFTRSSAESWCSPAACARPPNPARCAERRHTANTRSSHDKDPVFSYVSFQLCVSADLAALRRRPSSRIVLTPRCCLLGPMLSALRPSFAAALTSAPDGASNGNFRTIAGVPISKAVRPPGLTAFTFAPRSITWPRVLRPGDVRQHQCCIRLSQWAR